MSGIYCMNDKCRMADGQLLVDIIGTGESASLVFYCAYCGAKQRMDIDRYNELVNPAFMEE